MPLLQVHTQNSNLLRVCAEQVLSGQASDLRISSRPPPFAKLVRTLLGGCAQVYPRASTNAGLHRRADLSITLALLRDVWGWGLQRATVRQMVDGLRCDVVAHSLLIGFNRVRVKSQALPKLEGGALPRWG